MIRGLLEREEAIYEGHLSSGDWRKKSSTKDPKAHTVHEVKRGEMLVVPILPATNTVGMGTTFLLRRCFRFS